MNVLKSGDWNKPLERIGYFCVLLVMAGFIWSAPYILTGDGSSHALNARIIVDLLTGECDIAQEIFRINPHILPNWTGHAFMVALIYGGLSALVAEKIVFMLAFVLMAVGFRALVLAAKGEPMLSWPILPLALNSVLTLGFYNYQLGVGIGCLALANYLTLRNKPNSPLFIFSLSLLLLAVWFSHIIAFLGCSLFILVNELFLLRAAFRFHVEKISIAGYLRRNIGLAIAFLPALVLTINYLLTSFIRVEVDYTGMMPGKMSLLYIIALYDFISDFSQADIQHTGIMLVLGASSLLFIGYYLVRRTAISRIAAVALVCTSILWGMSFATQLSFKGGWLLDIRLRMLGWQFAFLALSLMVSRRQHASFFVYVSILLAFFNTSTLARSVDKTTALREKLAPVMSSIGDGDLVYSLETPIEALPTIRGYESVRLYWMLDKKCTYDLNNYEAAYDYFPVRYKTDLVASTLYRPFSRLDDRSPYFIGAPKMDNISRREFEKLSGLKVTHVIQFGDVQNPPPAQSNSAPAAQTYIKKHGAEFYNSVRRDVLDGFSLVKRVDPSGGQPITVFKRKEN